MKRLVLFIIILFVWTAGCQQNAENESVRNQTNDDPLIKVRNNPTTNENQFDNESLANHLAEIANSVPQVEGATAVVAGPYAVVGIDVDQDLDRQRVGTIKYTVTEALQDDPYGKTAIVVADADIMTRLEGMGEKISQGYPIQGVVDELAQIVGRYMPEIPMDDIPEEPDNNKKSISDEHEDQLEDIQKEQSGPE